MSKIKLIIEIDNSIYDICKSVRDLPLDENDIMSSLIMQSVANGTPLEKGHGRLIDADKYRHMWVDTFDSCYGNACSKLFKDSVDNADTIIEADKRGDEE